MLNFIPRCRLTLQSLVTSKVLVNVTIGMGDFVHSSKAMALLVSLGLISCFILFILVLKDVLLSVVEKIEVRPACVFGIEVLLAAILEAETLVKPVGGRIRGKGIETDGSRCSVRLCRSVSPFAFF